MKKTPRLDALALALMVGCGGYAASAEAQPAVTDDKPSPAVKKMQGSEAADGPEAPGDDAETENDGDQEQAKSEKMVAVNLQGANLKQISRFLMDQLGKPVLVGAGVDDFKLAVAAPSRMPMSAALELLGNALRSKGVIIVASDRVTQLLPVAAVRQIPRALVPADQSVVDLPDSSMIVDKLFTLQYASAGVLKDAVLSSLPDYAFLTADPNLNTLTVTAAAADLVQVERLVSRLDVPGAGAVIERIFVLKHAEPSEVANLVRTVLAGSLGLSADEVYVSPLGGADANSSKRGGNSRGGDRGNKRGGNNKGGDQGPGTLLIQGSDAPITLTPDVARRWIIASAPPRVMAQIETWVAEFDRPGVADPTSPDGAPAPVALPPYELLEVQHVGVEELSEQLTQAIVSMPDAAVRNGVRVVPFANSDRLLVYGSARGRELVATLLAELDVAVDLDQVFEEITLEHAPAETVKLKIEELFDTAQPTQSRRFFFGNRGNTEKKELTVSADNQRNSITIKTDRARMQQIKDLIKERWDTPLDYGEVQPRVYNLKYTDPVQVQTLLDDMFSSSSSSSSFNFFSGTRETTTSASVGRLFGQFSFQALADSTKLIVSTKTAANYQVIDRLIEELDVPQDAGLPIIVPLKHSNAEDLAEQLNAMFSEPGTPASITRNERGLTDAIRGSSTDRGNTGQGGGNNNNNNNDDEASPDAMAFWWSQSRPDPNSQATSNLIGKPRFVPVNRRNALMVLAPRAQAEPFRKMVEELDRPGTQVLIHAVVTEITHDDATTLGVRLASDASILSDSRLADQSISGSLGAAFGNTFANGDGTLNIGVDVNALLSFLIDNLDLKILNEPRLSSADNEEAHFFDGQDVPVITGDQNNTTNTNSFTRNFEYQPIGTRLQVRPHITSEGAVDVEVNLELSRIVTGSSVFGNFIFDRFETTTNVTVQDGQTIVVSGIVRQEDFNEIRKFPILGDLPLIGGLFRSTDKAQRNREVIAFITPHVMSVDASKAKELSDENVEWLNRIRGAVRTPDVAKENRRDPDNKEDRGLFTTPGERDLDPETR